MQDFVPKFYMLLTSSGAVWQIEEGCVVDISEYVTHCTAPLNTFTFHFVHIYLSYVRDDSSREARSWTTSLLHYSHYVSLGRKDHRSQHYRKVRCKRWPPYTLRAFRMCVSYVLLLWVSVPRRLWNQGTHLHADALCAHDHVLYRLRADDNDVCRTRDCCCCERWRRRRPINKYSSITVMDGLLLFYQCQIGSRLLFIHTYVYIHTYIQGLLCKKISIYAKFPMTFFLDIYQKNLQFSTRNFFRWSFFKYSPKNVPFSRRIFDLF